MLVAKVTSQIVYFVERAVWDSTDKTKKCFFEAFLKVDKEVEKPCFFQKRVLLGLSGILFSFPLLGAITFSLYGTLFAKAFLIRALAAFSFSILLASLYQKSCHLEEKIRGLQSCAERALVAFQGLEQNLAGQIKLYEEALQKEKEAHGFNLQRLEEHRKQLAILSFFGNMLYSLQGEDKGTLFLIRFESYISDKRELDLSFLGSHSLPQGCFRKGFEDLEVLELSWNHFSEIPEEVKELAYLQAQRGKKLSLKMEGNPIERLPPDFYSWALCLEELSINFSCLQDPPPLEKMHSLRRAIPCFNPITPFSQEMIVFMQEGLGDIITSDKEIEYLDLFLSLKEEERGAFSHCFSHLLSSHEWSYEKAPGAGMIVLKALRLCKENADFKEIFIQSCKRALQNTYFESSRFLLQTWHDVCFFKNQFPEGKTQQEFFVGLKRRLRIQEGARKQFFHLFFHEEVFRNFVIFVNRMISEDNEEGMKGFFLIISRIERHLFEVFYSKIWFATLPRETISLPKRPSEALELSVRSPSYYNIQVIFDLKSLKKSLMEIT